MSESQILTYNERIKAFSNFLFNLAAALTAAAAARVWAWTGPDLTALAWLIVSAILLSIASRLLYLLEPERQESD